MLKRLLILLVLNFSALAIGGLFTGDGASSSWYQSLNKAPWTPPGWAFGTAWALIMVCFAFYMAQALATKSKANKAIWLFVVQWLLNVLWNPAFFYFHEALAGMIIISLLTMLLSYMLFSFAKYLHWYSLLLLPYVLWLIIATSLNGFILFYN
jgi:benzodiazapine receptor